MYFNDTYAVLKMWEMCQYSGLVSVIDVSVYSKVNDECVLNMSIQLDRKSYRIEQC